MAAKRPRRDRQLEIFRRMSAQRKLELAAELRETNLRLLRAGIRFREPGISTARLRLRVLEHVLPPRLFQRFYAPDRT